MTTLEGNLMTLVGYERTANKLRDDLRVLTQDIIMDTSDLRSQVLQTLLGPDLYGQVLRAEEKLMAEEEERIALAKSNNDVALQMIEAKVMPVKAAVDKAIIDQKKSEKVPGLTVVYTKPRVTYDSDWMDGYSAGHPEVLPARKEGKASISYRYEHVLD